MSDQFDMFGKKAPFVPGSKTSEAAAERLPIGVLTALRRKVFDYIVSCEPRGATTDEAEVALKMLHQTASARFNELENMRFIFNTGRERNTRSRRAAAVYRPITSRQLEAEKDWLRPLGPPAPAPAVTNPTETNARYDGGMFIHDRCGADDCEEDAPFGIGYFPRKGRLGMWYCRKHWEERKADNEQASEQA